MRRLPFPDEPKLPADENVGFLPEERGDQIRCGYTPVFLTLRFRELPVPTHSGPCAAALRACLPSLREYALPGDTLSLHSRCSALERTPVLYPEHNLGAPTKGVFDPSRWICPIIAQISR